MSTSDSSFRKNKDETTSLLPKSEGTFYRLARRPVILLYYFISKLMWACFFFPIKAHEYVREKCQVKRWRWMCPVRVVCALTHGIRSYWTGRRDDGRRNYGTLSTE